MAIKMCHHHGFTVSDIETSLKFYRDALGLEVLRISERSDLPSYDHILGFPNVHLQVALLKHPTTDFLLELFQYVNPPSTSRELSNNFVGSSHVAFEVDDCHFVLGCGPEVVRVDDGVRVGRPGELDVDEWVLDRCQRSQLVALG